MAVVFVGIQASAGRVGLVEFKTEHMENLGKEEPKLSIKWFGLNRHHDILLFTLFMTK